MVYSKFLLSRADKEERARSTLRPGEGAASWISRISA
jgi:hypothetical protein